MSHTTVRAHTRRGYQVRAHPRRTTGAAIRDVLARDGERAIERAQARLSGECQHAGLFLAYHETGVTFFVCRCCQRHIDYSQMQEWAQEGRVKREQIGIAPIDDYCDPATQEASDV